MNTPSLSETVTMLVSSETGAAAAEDLLRFLDNRGCSLDSENQRRVADLLVAAWSGHSWSVIDELRRACSTASQAD